MNSPLADKIRPKTINDVFGQHHLLGKGMVLRNILETGKLPNMIFYGPSGTGKTTIANIAAELSNKRFYKLNATNSSVSDIKKIVAELHMPENSEGVLLYLDEIQNFNKKQQQTLLEFIETGDITLIASTTENPYFYVYNAILSRSTVFEFKPLTADDIRKAVNRALEILKGEINYNILIEDDAMAHICQMANGDVRRAINALELCVFTTIPNEDGSTLINVDIAEQCSQKKAMTYDKLGDNHYDILSAFQKSIRGSDPNAAVHYLARLVAADDLISICRRLMVISCEDIGLAYPSAVSIVKSCVDCAMNLGFPEARIPLAQATILLATAPKSNSAICAIDEALADISSVGTLEIPNSLRDAHYSGAKKLSRGDGYKYPHNFPNNYIEQQYLPDKLKNKIYYREQNNKFEQNIKDYWNNIKK